MKTTITMTIFATVLFASHISYAQQTAKEGMSRLEENIENSKHNTELYKKNLQTVEENLVEVKKAQDTVQAQMKKMQGEITAHAALSKKMNDQEKQLAGLIQTEKDKNAKDEARLKEIEKLIAQIKQNQDARLKNQQDYERQLGEMTEYRKQWQIQADALKDQQNEVQKNLNDIKTQAGTWNAKKKGYEGEVKRWSAETDKQVKAHKTMRSLAEATPADAAKKAKK